ncbi:MAG: hypothetical protein RIS35_3202 [Pseudomonadota bacterium]|jgi:hypothetical protein
MSILRSAWAVWLGLVMASLLAACGGGGGAGAQGDAGGGSGSAASISVLSSTQSLASDGRAVATITALARDSLNRATAGQLVEFVSDDTGSVLEQTAATTDASGSATATLRLIDPTNRTITIQARIGALQSSVQVSVIGTVVTIGGPSSVAAGADAEFTVGLRDAAGVALAGRAVAVSSSAGNRLSASSVVTDAAGQARFSLTGSVAGLDTLSVSALGARASTELQVSSRLLTFVSPASGQEVPVATPETVTVYYASQGVPQTGRTVQFAATRGVLGATSGQTDGTGRASVTLTSATAGFSTVTALVDGVSSSLRVEFVSRIPAKLALQPSPANVGVNPSASSLNSSQLIATVRDAADNPVKGQTVAFSAISDPSNGRIEPAVATTDSSGIASVAFFPGANSSGFNQIVLKARVLSSDPLLNVEGTATLTASRQELFVRMGTGNTIEVLDASTYAKPWSVVVTDSSGNPVRNASVQAAITSTRFLKGSYVAGTQNWVPVEVQSCLSEDLNGNLRLDTGEDRNGDTMLTPGNVAAAVVSSEGGVTDANGIAGVRVVYPKSFANWVEVQLRVTGAVVAGTEGVATVRFVLPAVVGDLSLSVSPPGGIDSPFGRETGCDNTR